MVRFFRPLRQIIAVLGTIGSTSVYGLLPQTQNDLEQLKDRLRDWSRSDTTREENFPMLLAPPEHYWQESRNDFGDAVLRAFKSVFTKSDQEIILCDDCDTHRMQTLPNQNVIVNNGPLSMWEMKNLQESVTKYKAAKSFATIRETPAGVALRVVDIQSGHISFFALADSTQTLNDAEPWLHFAKEYDRRKRQEGITHFRGSLGFYPSPLLQVEFVEQFGDYNQHLLGLGIMLNNVGVGMSYKWLTPFAKKLDLGIAIFLPITSAIASDNKLSKMVVQGMATYTLSDNYGFFAAANLGGENSFSLGFSFYNPLLITPVL